MTSSPSAANTRAVFAVFEKYQKERLMFVQTVADLASRETNIEALQGAGVMSLLRPLLLDNVPAIQQAAALALGRLANYNEEMAQSVVDSDILPQLVYSLSEQNRFYKKAAAFVLRAVAKHSPDLAQSVVDSGALTALISCLEEFDPGVKESAAWALGYIARHSGELAQAVVDAGAIPLLVLCVQEPELSLRRIAASALSDTAKHSPELAQCVVDANTVPIVAPLLANPDAKLRRQVCSALAQIAKHTVDLAETVVDGEIFPSALDCLKDVDGYVKKNAATLVCEIAKHTPELAQLIVNSGGIAAVVDYVNETRGNARLPGIMTLGYVAAFSETLALAVIVAKGVPPLTQALVIEGDEHIKAACAWSLGQIGRHSPDHAKTLADHAVLSKLLRILTTTSSPSDDASSTTAGADLKTKTKRALKCILEKTLAIEALDPLLQPQTTPANILKYVVGQFAKILPHDVGARRAFVINGGLQRVQEIAGIYAGGTGVGVPGTLAQQVAMKEGAAGSGNGLAGTKMGEYIRAINQCYPEEIVRYYSPGYSTTLLEKIDEYSKQQDHAATANAQPQLPKLPSTDQLQTTTQAQGITA
ncbi:armadillo-type protein [Fimicolochytrium jonesii]|uniref:armadillo-type protein n=1 Tax=Fimicolochytrium jonesii TaxID=1396493 RepID=UPI0022FDEEE0|nr:armadillo-type protein [Fimicolochytrium jonesii]KAI8820874.1 armadillo-type protein [Fimicolochytrium jonesii]